jgi:hypothetical protein
MNVRSHRCRDSIPCDRGLLGPQAGCCCSSAPRRRASLRAAERPSAFSSGLLTVRLDNTAPYSQQNVGVGSYGLSFSRSNRAWWEAAGSPDYDNESARLLGPAGTFVASARAIRKVLFRPGRTVMRAENILQTRHRFPPCASVRDMHTTIHTKTGITEIPRITPLCQLRSPRARDVGANSIVRHRDRAFVSRRAGPPAATSSVEGAGRRARLHWARFLGAGAANGAMVPIRADWNATCLCLEAEARP